MSFNSSDVQSVFSGNIAESWEQKSRYIGSIDGNDNMMIPMIKKYVTSAKKFLEVGCGTGKLLKQVDSLVDNITLTGVEMSRDMLQQIDISEFNNPIRLINDSIENFTSSEMYDIIIMKQVLHHVVSRKLVLEKLSKYLTPTGVIIIMTPNEGYQNSIIPFNREKDVLGRINDGLEDIDEEYLYKNISVVPQSTVILSGKLRDILNPAKRDISDNKIIETLKKFTVDYSIFENDLNYEILSC